MLAPVHECILCNAYRLDGTDPAGQNSSSPEGEQEHADIGSTTSCDGSPGEGPFLVIYMIDPFSYSPDLDEQSRLAMIGILRCYHDMLQAIPETLQSVIQLQVCWYNYVVIIVFIGVC